MKTITLPPFLKFLRSKWDLAVVLLIILASIGLRLSLYTDPRLSIGADDSKSYLKVSQLPLTSWEFFTARRPFTLPLFFKALAPAGGHELTVISQPAAHTDQKYKKLQPGLDRVAVGQMIIAIFSWSLLTWVVARHLRSWLVRILSALFIMGFAFTPPMADWDSVLMSESLAFSLFALLMAITIELIFRILQEGKQISLWSKILLGLWALVVLFWAFIRDTNSYAILITALALGAALIVPVTRRRLPLRPLILLIVAMLGVYTFHDVTYKASHRFGLSFFNLYRSYMKGSELRREFFLSRGMPPSNYIAWADDNGARVYGAFLLSHPGFVFYTFYDRTEDIFSENQQPFFFENPIGTRGRLITLGSMLHPKSSVVLPLVSLQTLLILFAWLKNRTRWRTGWGIFVAWLYATEVIMLGVSFFGDSYGIIRHTMGATVFMRFSIWLLSLIIAEFSLFPAQEQTA